MELAKVSVRLTSLLASIAALWALFRRLKSQQPSSSRSPFPTGPTASAQGEAAAVAPPQAAAVAPPQANGNANVQAPAPEQAPVAKEAVKEKQGPNGVASAPKAAPKPRLEAEALKIAENAQLAECVKAAVTLHGRAHETVDTSGAVKTSYVPDISPQASNSASGSELVLSRIQLMGLLGAVEVAGLLCLALAMTIGAGASVGLVVVCLLLAAAAVALVASSKTRHTPSSQPAGAVHASAAVRHDGAAAVWRAVAAWAEGKASAGKQRCVAWRNGLAFLVEAAPGATEYEAFVLEPGPLVVHHYAARPGLKASSAPEAAWGLRGFLAQAEDGDGVIADDAPPNALFGPSSVAPKKYKKVKVILSQKDGVKLQETANVELHEGIAGMSQEASIFISPNRRMNKQFVGFGGSFTESSAVVFSSMTSQHQEEVLQAYFNPVFGAGYSIGRMSMGSCDFGLGNWSCGDLKDFDHELTDFNIDHYHKEILPLYHRAAEIAGCPLWMLASPWSPPPWMKTKMQWNGDAHLRLDAGKAWARHFVRFVKDMAKAGVRIMAVTVQNEPEAAQIWESCIYTATEERDFVRDHLGPTLRDAGLSSVKVLIWDHNRDGMFERAQIAYADPEAAKYIWGCAYHWYGDARFEAWPDRSEIWFPDRQREWKFNPELRARMGSENLKRVAELAPDKHILFTEGCQELSGVPLQAIVNEWKFGERYGMNIITDLNNGCEGWIDWNLFLNEHGGPNHVGNNCLAPIIYDTQQKQVNYTPAFFVVSHFSRFIRPGARRVLCSTSRDILEITAWANTDETIVVVVMNQSAGNVDFKLKLGGEGTEPVLATQLTAPGSSIMTLVLE